MRKILTAIIVLSLSFVMTPTKATDAPTGCPSTWGMKFDNGKEITGILDLAIKTYGAGKIYKNIESYATVGDKIVKNIGAIPATPSIGRSWYLISLSTELGKPIIFHDKWSIRFESCPEFIAESNREPIEISISQNISIELAVDNWAVNYSAASGNRVVPLETKDRFKSQLASWITSLKNAKVVPPCEDNAICFPAAQGFSSGTILTLRSQYGYLVLPHSGVNCTEGDDEAFMFVRFGCSYDLVIPNGTQTKNFVGGETIFFQGIETIDFPLPNKLPTPTPKSSSSTSNQPQKSKKVITIRCQKGKTVKKVMGYNPSCPKGYAKL